MSGLDLIARMIANPRVLPSVERLIDLIERYTARMPDRPGAHDQRRPVRTHGSADVRVLAGAGR